MTLDGALLIWKHAACPYELVPATLGSALLQTMGSLWTASRGPQKDELHWFWCVDMIDTPWNMQHAQKDVRYGKHTHTQHTCRVFWVMRFWSLLGDCCVSITVLLWDRQNCRTEFSLREIFVTAGLLEASYSLLLSLAMCNPHDVRTVILKQLTCRQPVEHCRLRAQDLILCED